jgi:hypothetical protein
LGVSEVLHYIRGDKWTLRFFIVFIGIAFGSFYTFINSNNPMGPPLFFTITTFSVVYVLLLFLENHHKIISPILGKWTKKIVSKWFYGKYVYAVLGWFIIGTLLIIFLKNAIVISVWAFGIAALITIYPCIATLAIYISSYKYLRKDSDDSSKRTVFNSLTIASVGLTAPWIFTIFLVLAFLSVTLVFWVNFILVVTIYLGIFLAGIYFPYYQSMDKLKQSKIKELELFRQSVIDQINDNNVHKHVALELKIQRIDREIEKVSSKSSHPYSVIKSIGTFIFLIIIGGMLANILGDAIKYLLHF